MYYCPRHAVKELRGKGVAIIMSIINSIIEQDQQTRICSWIQSGMQQDCKGNIYDIGGKKEIELVVLVAKN